MKIEQVEQANKLIASINNTKKELANAARFSDMAIDFLEVKFFAETKAGTKTALSDISEATAYSLLLHYKTLLQSGLTALEKQLESL